MTTTPMQVPQLESGNFENWLFRIEIALDEKGIRHVIKSKIDDKEDSVKQDAKARHVIIQALPDKYLEYVKGANTAFDMIEKLTNVFQRKSTVSSLCLKRQLINLKCKKTDSIQEHLTKFEKLVQDINSNGIKMEEKERVCQLLLSVEDAYGPLVAALEVSNTELTVDFIKSKLLDAEIRERTHQGPTTSTRRNEYVFQSSTVKCYKCGEPNHFARNCCKSAQTSNLKENNRQEKGKGNNRGRSYQRGTHHNKSNVNRRPAANIGENQDVDSKVLFIAAQAHSAEDRCYVNRDIEFVIDSGASYHMVNNKYERYMIDIQEIPIIHIQVANGNTITANKKGKLIGTSSEGIEITIENCLIVEKLTHNLLSVLKLNEKGIVVTFEKKNTIICKGNIKVKGQSNGKLCTLKLNLNETNTLLTEETDGNLWHKRMCHLNYSSMKILGLPLSNERCSICMEAKASRVTFKENPTPRTKGIGELIYCDIGGPVTPICKDGERYYLTIIDDYSHFMEVHLLKSKDEAKNYIMRYVKIMRNNGNNVKRIRTDRGTEFVNEELKNFYEEYGIVQQTTCSYTPQQNSICERMNRTLADRVRAMLLETNLPKYLWGEAIRCAAYTINRSPTKALRGDTPAKIWYGKNNLEKIRVFGSKAWGMIFPRPSKLEPRAKPMIMIGYCGSGYRLWDPTTNDIIESRDVRFDESDYRYNENEKGTHTIAYNEEEEETETSKSHESISELTNTEREIGQDQRQRRTVNLPKRYDDYDMSNVAYALISEDPICYKEAIGQGGWTEAIEKELEAHRKLRTWEESDLPKGHKAIDTKWVFRTKADNTKKARLVAKGFQEETTQNVYAPVARMTTIRLFLNKAIQEDLPIKQLDIPTAFLNGELKTNIYIKYPEGLENTKEGKVLKLRKALYGLKEAPRCWNEKLNNFLTQNGFQQSLSDFCLYTGADVYILIFVDDILIMGDGQTIIQKLKDQFQAKDMGNISTFLGMEIIRSRNCMEIKQTKIIEKILLKFHMQDCKGSNTPMENVLKINENEEILTDNPYRQLTGSLMYLATISRPDIAYATGFLSRYMNRPTPTLWKAAKRVLRYLKQTKEKGLVYRRENTNNNHLQAFSDSDWGSEQMDRKSVSGVAIFHRGNLVSWSSKKQTSVALSTAESEYIAAALSVSEIVFIREVLRDLQCNKNLVCSLLIDNQSTIKMIESYENSKRSKHIDIKVHFIKDIVNKGLLTLKYVSTNENKADILTKSLSQVKHNYFCKLLGLY